MHHRHDHLTPRRQGAFYVVSRAASGGTGLFALLLAIVGLCVAAFWAGVIFHL